VIHEYGESKWQEISNCLQERNFTEDDDLPDETTYQLFNSAIKILNVGKDEFIEAVGYWFFLFLKDKVKLYFFFLNFK
jgi:hypothetical protein